MLTAKDIEKANEGLSTIDVKGKEYVQVNTRVAAFRKVCPSGSITTEIVSLENGVVTMKTTITDEEGRILSTGFAQEKESGSYINKTSYIENCETSAVGRALGMAGFGIDTSIASAEELNNRADDGIIANPEGKLVMVEFFDFACSYCNKIYPALKEIIAKSIYIFLSIII